MIVPDGCGIVRPPGETPATVTVVLSYALLRFNVEDVLEDMKEVRMKDFVTKYGDQK
jgi:hypothetical protein